MNVKPSLSIIVPTLNESENIVVLCDRIDASLRSEDIAYEIIVVDDHSTDNTVAAAKESSAAHYIRAMIKAGKPGKAYSLLEGFAAARNDIICMIDADLQYPPEAILPMYTMLTSRKADVVISERYNNETNFVRKLVSRGFNLIFARLLFGIRYDTQSGLKLFRKDILKDFTLMPSPWSFDLEFLVRSLENKRKILSYPIPFIERERGVTKVKVLSVSYELAKASLMLRATTSFQKLRAGHRANSRFVEQITAAIITGFIIVAGFNLNVPKASALEIDPTDPVIPTAQVVPVIDDTTGGVIAIISNPPVTDPSTISTPTPPTIQPSIQPAAPAVQPASSATEMTATASTMSAAATRPASSPYSLPANSSILQVADSTGAANNRLQVKSNDTLAAATATKPSSAFAGGYPSYLSTDSLVQRLKLLVPLLTAGGLALAGAYLITSRRRFSHFVIHKR